MNAFSMTTATAATTTTIATATTTASSHRVFLMSHQDHAPCRRKLRVEWRKSNRKKNL
jgi:hypothetical protein